MSAPIWHPTLSGRTFKRHFSSDFGGEVIAVENCRANIRVAIGKSKERSPFRSSMLPAGVRQERGTVPICSADCANLGQSPAVLLEPLIQISEHRGCEHGLALRSSRSEPFQTARLERKCVFRLLIRGTAKSSAVIHGIFSAGLAGFCLADLRRGAGRLQSGRKREASG